MAAGSTIVIAYNDVDITSYCVFAECTFESQMAAIPGTFKVTIKDQHQTFPSLVDFETGGVLTLDVDGVRLYGGFVLQISKTYFFPAADTRYPSTVPGRKWIFEGSDFNIFFDKSRLRNTADYTHQLPNITAGNTDGGTIRTWFTTYFDIPSFFDFTNASYILDNYTFTSTWAWPTQGASMREVLEGLGAYGSVYWIDATGQLNFLPVQDTAATWGFSDKPNNNAIGAGTPTRGFRDGTFTEDATSVINDALVWGGSEWTVGGNVVFARRQNTTSIDTHGRWQTGENRVGNANYKVQSEVDIRANIIVDGNASGSNLEGTQGQVNPEKTFRCTWFSVDVPINAGYPVHLRPGQVVPIELWVFAVSGDPFEVTLPLRQMSISFPALDRLGHAYVQFDGYFGVLMSDPKWLWVFLREGRTQASTILVTSGANNSSTNPPYGSMYQGIPSPAPDGSTTIFTIPFGYISGTSRVFVNGLMQVLTTSYTESDPANGEITFTWAPPSTDTLMVEATLSG